MANEIADILDEEQKKEERNLDDAADFRTYCLDNIKLFENLYDDFAGVNVNFSEVDYHPCTQLNEQRRLPPLISDMISSIFYETKFIKVKETPDKGDPFTFPLFLEENELIWIDTPYASKNFLEKKDSSRSKYNEGEIQTILKLLRKIKINKFFINKKTDLDIVFLTPYNAQTKRLSKFLSSSSIGDFDPRYLSTRCYNIDAYQGKQADVIVISLVRNNKELNIRSALGFLVEEPRLNVLFSRVKKRMIIIGCSKQFTRLKANRDCRAINEVFEFIKQKGFYIKTGELEGLL
jgi:superfamily I DNA and/or RNA helicase